MESTDNIDNTNINIREIENENKLKDMMSIESYINSSKLELHNYINQYKNYYYSSVKNTLVYFELFKEVICDYSIEINSNVNKLYDNLSKLNEISDELPLLEELYEKVREMKNSLEMVYNQLKYNNNNNNNNNNIKKIELYK